MTYPPNGYLAPVVKKVDNAIHRINHYPLDGAIGFPITYGGDLSGRRGYPSFEQLKNRDWPEANQLAGHPVLVYKVETQI